MAKQEIKSKQTNIVDKTGAQGHQVEQTLTVDDNCLPQASELIQYKDIDVNIIPFIIETTKKEQQFRHDFEKRRLKVFHKGNRREYLINWWGMFFACLVMLSGLGLAAFLIYNDKNHFCRNGIGYRSFNFHEERYGTR
jgi:uncharacterized membrane protein